MPLIVLLSAIVLDGCEAVGGKLSTVVAEQFDVCRRVLAQVGDVLTGSCGRETKVLQLDEAGFVHDLHE